MLRLSVLLLCLLVGLLPAGRVWGQADSVQVELDRFGVANHYRPGEFAAIRVVVTGAIAEPTPIWIQLEVPNADGDIGEYGRALTLNRNQNAEVWLYAPMPPDIDPRSVLAVRVFELEDGERGRELGGARISPSDVGATRVSPMKSMIGVVSPRPLGLSDYMFIGGMPDERPPFAHEDTRVVFGIKPSDLPDHWEGLRVFEAIAWGDEPPTLRTAQAKALRAYIERGGQLAIVLPAQGNPWNLGQPTQVPELDDLLPRQQPQKNEAVPVADLLPVTSKRAAVDASGLTTSIWVFQQLGGAMNLVEEPYEPLIALRDGRVIVVRRPVGFGFLSLIGIDLGDRQLMSVPGLIETDVFWNRILGRRVDTPATETLQALQDEGDLRTTASENGLGGGQLVGDLISMSEAAGRGLLTVFVVIVLYWALAGPVGFYLLKFYKQESHAWIAFAASAGVFTAAAWGIVALIKPSTYEIQHLTFLDIRPDPSGGLEAPLHRATSWFSLNMPGYRRTGVFVDSEAGQRDLIASWTPPDLPGQPFPNPDRFRVDVGNDPADYATFVDRNEGRAEYRRPSRATATQLYAHWLGATPAWEGTIWQWQDRPVRVVSNATAGTETLQGVLEHDLPGDLVDVQLIWVRSARYPPRQLAIRQGLQMPWVRSSDSGGMLNHGGVWRKSSWPAGEALSLADETQDQVKARLPANLYQRYVEPYERSGGAVALPSSGGRLRDQDVQNYLEMLGFFNQLDPPVYIDTAMREGNVAFFRMLGRELDLSTWLTRPCLIVTGRLIGVGSPVPLLVNGERPVHDESSVVMVRWIMPLELAERIAFPAAFGETPRTAAADTSNAGPNEIDDR